MNQPGAAIMVNRSLEIIAASPAGAEWLETVPAQLLGRTCRAVMHCTAAEAQCPVRQALTGSQPGAGVTCSAGRRRSQPLVIRADVLSTGAPAAPVAMLTLQSPGVTSLPVSLPDRRWLSLDEVEGNLQEALDVLRRLFRSDLTALALYEPETRQVQWKLVSGNISRQTTDIRLRPWQGFAGRIVGSGRPLETAAFPHDITRDPRSYPIFVQEELRSALGVPLEAGGRPIGVVMVANRAARPFTAADRQSLAGVAQALGLAAENLRLLQVTHQRAVTSERRRLSAEVHDGLSQQLFGLQLLLKSVQEAMKQGDGEGVQAGLQDVCRLLDRSLVDARGLITRLRGEDRPDTDLVRSLCDYLEYFYRTSGLQVELALEVPADRPMGGRHGEEVLRIAQEALSNVRRHGQAQRVHVLLAPVAGGYLLQVRDDGRGFDPTAPQPPGHFGLEIMRERARRLGGELEIRSDVGTGTTVAVRFPMAE